MIIAVFGMSFIAISAYFYSNFRSMEESYNKNKEVVVPLLLQIGDSNRILESINGNLLDYSSEHTVGERNSLMVKIITDLDSVDTMILKLKQSECGNYIDAKELQNVHEDISLLKSEIWDFFGYKSLTTQTGFTPLNSDLTRSLLATSQELKTIHEAFTKLYIEKMTNEYNILSDFIPKMLVFSFFIAFLTTSLLVLVMSIIFKNLGADPKDIRRICGNAIEGHCFITDESIVKNSGGIFSELFLLIQFIKEKELFLQEEIDEQVHIIRKQNQELISTNRAAAMGEMIGNIAHQWRQPLHAIGLNLIDARFDLEDKNGLPKEKGDKLLTVIEEQVRYLSQTIDDFRNFFSPQKEKNFFNLSDLFVQLDSLVKKSLESQNITLINALDEKIKQNRINDSIYGYSNELLQVLLNIVSNAKDALLESSMEHKTITIDIEQSTQESLTLLVQDNGGGIPNDVLPKIFDPYFSTKHQKQGTGIGLYMSRIIVEEHHKGSLFATNENGGALFHIVLPLH